MKKIITLALLLITINVHASFSCAIRDRVETTLPDYIATTLECTNTDAISTDIGGFLDRIRLCPADGQKVEFGAIFCQVTSTYVVDQMVKVIPAEWECKVTKASDLVKEMLVARCLTFVGSDN
ncbi:MAG: hypothetical protein HN353_09215 [Bdellovibrionales bacterium]|jgi:hypothetical protein|nr:hypothetical protein [Bdellovibrionales bacterium]MBT3527311.1 hypothetical protein [Bdellovibrionales bacterium]MBT7669324.1 hypothetical protein [Bdellovibrionales bacterium]MBT7767032.1 hypothetical protein [Bdellovibrionales bacterium]